jgi:hypothetical protein
MTTFETGQKYGNDLTIEIVKRTAKTVTIKSNFGTQRFKIRGYYDGAESISCYSWLIDANEIFNAEVAAQEALDNSYYR